MKQYSIFLCFLWVFTFPIGAFGNGLNCDFSMGNFASWLQSVSDKKCAEAELSKHDGLQVRDIGGDIVSVANGYHAAIQRFFEILDSENYDLETQEVIKGRAKELGKNQPVKEFKKLIIIIPRIRQDIKGAITLNGISITNLAKFNSYCGTSDDQKKCERLKNTVALIGAMNFVISPYHQKFNGPILDNVGDQLEQYISVWDTYFEERKPQLPWEMLINQISNRDVRAADYFAMPPEGDWILFHPSIVYSSVSGAKSGQEKELSLALEILGYNWWRNKSLSGFSVVAVTSDREGISDDGYGLMFHFGSRYSLGWTKYNKEEGWFVSMDLLGAAQNKKTELNLKKDEFQKAIQDFKSNLKQ